MLVVAAIRNGLLEEALEHMDVLLSSSDGLPEERFELLAGLLSREHDVHESFRLMERFVASRRDNPSALYAYAHLAMRAGELEKARAAVDEVLAQRPGWHNAVTLRVRILLLADGPDAAMAYLAEAVRENPEDDELRVAYARALTDARRYQEAIDQYAVLAERVSPNTDAAGDGHALSADGAHRRGRGTAAAGAAAASRARTCRSIWGGSRKARR